MSDAKNLYKAVINFVDTDGNDLNNILPTDYRGKKISTIEFLKEAAILMLNSGKTDWTLNGWKYVTHEIGTNSLDTKAKNIEIYLTITLSKE